MSTLVPSVNPDTMQLPAVLRAVQAANLIDGAQPEGAALEKKYPKSSAVKVSGVTPEATIASAVAFGVGDVYFPAGTFTLGADVTIPATLRLHGAGMGVTTLFAPSITPRTIKLTGSASPWGSVILEGISLNGISVLIADTTGDAGRGSGIRDVEIYNVATGLAIKNNTWAFRLENCRFYNCTVAGVKHDFSTVAANSGANISYVNCVFFGNAVGWWQDSTAVDGWHTSFVDCDIENNGVGVKLTSVGDGALDLTNTHFENNSTAHVQADSGFIFQSGGWMFGLKSSSTSKVALFDLSGTAVHRVVSGRVQWDVTQLYRITGSAQLIWNRPMVHSATMGAVTAFGTTANPATADSTAGHQITSGVVTGREQVTDINITPHGTGVTLFQMQKGDQSTYEFTGRAILSAAQASNTAVFFINPDGNVPFNIPTAATWFEFRVVWAPTRVYISVSFSDGSVQTGAFTPTSNIYATRALALTIGSTGTSTAIVRNIIARVS